MPFIGHRHSVANIKYMKNYDPSKPSKYIMYYDANNLYGWAMMQKLAIGGYRLTKNTQGLKTAQLFSACGHAAAFSDIF